VRNDRVCHYTVEAIWDDLDGHRYVDTVTADPDTGDPMSLARALSVADTYGPPTSKVRDVSVAVVELAYTRIHGSDQLRLAGSRHVRTEDDFLERDYARMGRLGEALRSGALKQADPE